MKKLLFLILLSFINIQAQDETSPKSSAQITTDPYTCNSTTKGKHYYNTTSNVERICNGTSWGNQGGGAPTTSTYILQTADGSLSNAQALGSLNTGSLSVTTTTGVVRNSNPHDLSGAVACVDSSGSGTTYTCNTTAGYTPSGSGDFLEFCPQIPNSGTTPTLAVNSGTAYTIKKNQGQSALAANDLRGSPYCVYLQFDGSYWELASPSGNTTSGGTTTVAGLTNFGPPTGAGTATVTIPVDTTNGSSFSCIGRTPYTETNNQTILLQNTIASLSYAWVYLKCSNGHVGFSVTSTWTNAACDGTHITCSSHVDLDSTSATDFPVTVSGSPVIRLFKLAAGSSANVWNNPIFASGTYDLRSMLTSYNVPVSTGLSSSVGSDGTPTQSLDLTWAGQRHTCSMVFGADNGSALANADIGPQGTQCFIPFNATVIEVTVRSDAGVPSVVPAYDRAGSLTDLVSAALATGTSGAQACSNTGGTTGLDGSTTCSNTLQNTSLNAGDWIATDSGGTAGGTAKRMAVAVTYIPR